MNVRKVGNVILAVKDLDKSVEFYNKIYMDLTQRRLTAEEWTALEILVPPGEMKILKLIKAGYENENISYNDTLTLINFSKISGDLDKYHNFFYENLIFNL